MILNLKESTWEKLQHFAKAQGKSAASVAAKIIDDFVEKQVTTTYSIVEEKQTNG